MKNFKYFINKDSCRGLGKAIYANELHPKTVSSGFCFPMLSYIIIFMLASFDWIKSKVRIAGPCITRYIHQEAIIVLWSNLNVPVRCESCKVSQARETVNWLMVMNIHSSQKVAHYYCTQKWIRRRTRQVHSSNARYKNDGENYNYSLRHNDVTSCWLWI
jgi:hypothetical protein